MRRLARAEIELESFRAELVEEGIHWPSEHVVLGLFTVALTAIRQIEMLAPVALRSRYLHKTNGSDTRVNEIIRQVNAELNE